MEDCVFCNITAGNIDAEVIAQAEDCMVIRDILPKAPVHVLVISKTHIPSINEVDAEHSNLLGNMMLAGKKAAQQLGISSSGYKLIWNVGSDGGQTVPHIHLHVLGGKKLKD